MKTKTMHPTKLNVTYASPQAKALDEAFGLATATEPVTREGSAVTFGSLTPEEAKRRLEENRKRGEG